MSSEGVLMLIVWEEQRRLIQIQSIDDLQSVERKIREVYELPSSYRFHDYQIQFFWRTGQTYLDLHDQTWRFFQQLIEDLSSENRPAATDKSFCLQMVPRAKIDVAPRSNHHAEKLDQIGTAVVPKTSIFQHEDSRDTTISSVHHIEQQMTPESSLVGEKSPYHLRFSIDIDNRQRRQYECDMVRKRHLPGSDKPSGSGGVLLRARVDPNRHQSHSVFYPTVQFDIPVSERNQSWSLFVCVLTEADQNEIHYLHASKGIYDNVTNEEDRFGRILGSKLVNPYVVQLLSNDLEQGKYELRLRVCNIRNLSVHRHDELRYFPQNGHFMIYQDKKLISDVTTATLKMDSEKFHLGCLLVRGYIVQDRCISNLATGYIKRKKREDPPVETKKLCS